MSENLEGKWIICFRGVVGASCFYATLKVPEDSALSRNLKILSLCIMEGQRCLEP